MTQQGRERPGRDPASVALGCFAAVLTAAGLTILTAVLGVATLFVALPVAVLYVANRLGPGARKEGG